MHTCPEAADLASFQSVFNGLETNPTYAFGLRAVMNIRQAQVFSDVQWPGAELGAAALLHGQDNPGAAEFPVALNLAAVENLNRHQIARLLTVMAYVGTLFIVAPVLRLPEEEYDIKLSLRAVRAGGLTRRYESFASGSTRVTFGAHRLQAEQDLIREVRTRALNDLVNKLAADTSLCAPAQHTGR